MWRARRSFPLLPAAIGVVLVLLAALATLQYRWAGELSAAEHARLRASARTRAEALGRDFDAEVSRAFQALEMTRAEVKARDFGAWMDRYEAWQRAAAWPRMVRAVYLVEPDATDAVVSSFDPGSRSFATGGWPASLEPLRRRLSPEPGGRPRPFEPIAEEVPALVMLAFDRGAPGTGRPPMPGPPGAATPFVAAVLDLDVIRAQVLPALAERHFGGPSGLDHELRIVRQRERGTVVWASAGDPATMRVDAAAGLLELRGDQGPSGPRGGPGFPARAYGEDSGRWRLEVANRAGPLDQVVAAARRRNLGVGFGVLVLLLAAVSLIVVSAQRAQRLGERQMRFMAAVSHELRTPVAVIRGASDNLADGVVKDLDQMRVYGTVLRDESARLGEMIEDVLAFAGAADKERTHRSDAVAVAALVDDTLGALAATLRARDFTVERDVAHHLPPVRGDAAQLRHVLQNLVENAMKYDGGRRWVAIRAAFEPESREVVVSVVDRGRGIDPADLPHVFEPFYRGREAQERQVHGFGLGLALVRRTIEDHGGRVDVASTPGLGTTFTVRLPALAGEPALTPDGVDGLPHPSV